MYIASILRLIILTAIMAVSIILIFDSGFDNIENIFLFAVMTLIEKAVGIAFVVVWWILYRRWSVIDPWLSKYEQWCREADEARL